MKILIAVPCMDMIAAPFAQSLVSIRKVGQTQVGFIIGSLIYDARNQFAKQAITAGFDAVMWLDSDMIFDPDVLERMVKHLEEGKDIVAGLYFRRRPPYTPVLFKKLQLDENGKSWEDFDDYPKNSVFEVEGVGFGCCITRTTVLMDVMLNMGDAFTPVGGYGEDLSFCWRAREQGYKIWCDSSIKCGHLGQVIVNEDVYQSTL